MMFLSTFNDTKTSITVACSTCSDFVRLQHRPFLRSYARPYICTNVLPVHTESPSGCVMYTYVYRWTYIPNQPMKTSFIFFNQSSYVFKLSAVGYFKMLIYVDITPLDHVLSLEST